MVCQRAPVCCCFPRIRKRCGNSDLQLRVRLIERVDVGQRGHSRTVSKVYKPQRIASQEHLRRDARDVSKARHPAQRAAAPKCGSDKGCSICRNGDFQQRSAGNKSPDLTVDSLDVDSFNGLCIVCSNHIKIYLPDCCICDVIIITICLRRPFRCCNRAEIRAIIKCLSDCGTKSHCHGAYTCSLFKRYIRFEKHASGDRYALEPDSGKKRTIRHCGHSFTDFHLCKHRAAATICFAICNQHSTI